MGIFDWLFGKKKKPRRQFPVNFSLSEQHPDVPSFVDATLGKGRSWKGQWALALSQWTATGDRSHLDRARVAIQRAISEDPNAEFYTSLALTEQSAGDYDAAIDATINALNADATYPMLNNWLSSDQTFIDRIAAACNPQSPKFNPVRAERMWTIVIAFSQQRQKLHLCYSNRAAIRESLGDVEGAVEDLLAALKLDPSNEKLRGRLMSLRR